jgi:hypothetical protein
MMAPQHAKARSESTDDSDGTGVGSSQNFGSIMAQEKKLRG